LCASYIGGSVNFAAVSQSLGLAPGPLLAASMAADNIAMAVYLTAIMVIPAKNMIDSAHHPSTAAAAAAAGGGVKSAVETSSHQHHAQAARDVDMGQSAHLATNMKHVHAVFILLVLLHRLLCYVFSSADRCILSAPPPPPKFVAVHKSLMKQVMDDSC